MPTTHQLADTYRLNHGTPAAERPIAVLARALVDSDGNTVIDGDDLAELGAETVALSGALSVEDPATPSVTTTDGSTNTGFFKVKGKTSGSLKVTTADATARDITVTAAAQTTGNATLTIPDQAGVSSSFVFTTLAQTLTNKTLTAPVINGLTSASGNMDFSGSTGTFKTSTGLNTFGGKAAFKVIAAPVAAAGSAAGDSAAVGSANIVVISSDSAAKGNKLVTGVAGVIVHGINSSSTAAVLYPATGGTINGLSADAGVVIPASKGFTAFCTAADTWTVFDKPAKATAA